MNHVNDPVSSSVFSQHPTLLDRFTSIGWTVTANGCWEWNGSKHVVGGYGQIAGSRESGPLKAHRVSYELHKGMIPEGMLVRHHCDNPPCVNPNHLDVGHHIDNVRDAVSRGRAKHQVMTGEKAPASKLTWEDVAAIRSSDASGPELARFYDVSKVTISHIRRHKTWKEKGNEYTRTIR